MTALVTRPAADAAPVAAALRVRGIEVMIEPLLDIRPRRAVSVSLDGVQAVLATSANGVRALAAATARRDIPLYAVGEATAATARAAGFAAVTAAGGDAASLAQTVAARLQPAPGTLLHVAGSAVARDLGALLESQGFTVRRAVLYDAVESPALSDAAVAALGDGRIAMVLFFSPRTVRTFVMLARACGQAGACARATAFCLSDAVAAEAAALAWRAVRVAAEPTLVALLAAVDAEQQQRN
ncbi:MAG: uroporphyrinogen-III synthase [Rhodospirillales bacterium]